MQNIVRGCIMTAFKVLLGIILVYIFLQLIISLVIGTRDIVYGWAVGLTNAILAIIVTVIILVGVGSNQLGTKEPGIIIQQRTFYGYVYKTTEVKLPKGD